MGSFPCRSSHKWCRILVSDVASSVLLLGWFHCLAANTACVCSNIRVLQWMRATLFSSIVLARPTCVCTLLAGPLRGAKADWRKCHQHNRHQQCYGLCFPWVTRRICGPSFLCKCTCWRRGWWGPWGRGLAHRSFIGWTWAGRRGWHQGGGVMFAYMCL